MTKYTDRQRGLVKGQPMRFIHGHNRRGLKRPAGAGRRKNVCTHPDGCPRDAKSHGWCEMHWDRVQKTGKPGPLDGTRYFRGFLTYWTAHHAVRRLWGSPSQYLCAGGCGRQAMDWAYDHCDPAQLFGPDQGGLMCYYSEWPEFYMPMCRYCHRAMERAAGRRTLARQSPVV